jgi:hypothetical protein
MDWNSSLEDMTKSWVDMQNQLLSSFNAGVLGAAAPSAWQQTLDAWKAVVDSHLDAQAEMAARWASQAPESPETAAWAAQGQTMQNAWLASSRQLWNQWFEMSRAMDPTKAGWTGSGAGTDALRGWQEMARQMSEAQNTWLKTWMRS